MRAVLVWSTIPGAGATRHRHDHQLPGCMSEKPKPVGAAGAAARTSARSSGAVAADDVALFRAAVGQVAPIANDRAELRPKPPAPIPAQTRADERAAMRAVMEMPLEELALELSDPLNYAQSGVSKRLLRKLGRGEFSAAAELDLHGMNQREAATAIAGFLDAQRAARRLCVRIIHGKGLNSIDAQPVLKQLTDRILRRRGDVLAYRTARAADGGGGAVLVLIKPRN
jgi:DNA-nicking Smr family endonuclease